MYLFRSLKDKLREMQTSRVHKTFGSCGKSYIGQTERAIEVHLK